MKFAPGVLDDMKWHSIQDALANAKQLVLAPLANILCLGGVLLLLLAFFDVQYDITNKWTLHGRCSWQILLVALGIIGCSVVVFIISQKEGRFLNRLDYKKGVAIERDDLTILIKESEIQLISDVTRNTAFVLPANNTFADNCAEDDRTALGAYFIKHFPAEVASLPAYFKSALDSQGIIPIGDGQYALGTTILLPDRFSRPARVLITASTLRAKHGDISSNPHIICNCVEGIYKRTGNEQLDTVYLPILGSGHGGVDRGLALLFMLLAILHFAKTYHHLKQVTIVVHPKDIDSLNRSKELKAVLAL